MDFVAVTTAVTLTALGLLGYAYVGYPALLWLLDKVLAAPASADPPPRGGDRHRWPTVSVVVSVFNEAAAIGRRIENLLAQDYPANRLEILIGSDGSTDETCLEAERYRSARVHVHAFPRRRGKASVLNDLVARAKGDYVVFTDAATVFYPDAVRELMSAFRRHPGARVVGGRLYLRSSETSGNLDGLYWRYETWLKTMESRIGAGLGASGAIYAVRRRDYRPLPADTMADDLLEPMLVRLHTEGAVLLHEGARAWQVTPKRVADEFRRRLRTGAGIAHVLAKTWRLLLPRWGTVALAYWSHKVLRLLGPWLLLAAFGGSLALADRPLFRALVLAQAALYGLGFSAGLVRAVPILGAAASAARFFIALNAGLLAGLVRFACRRAGPMWQPTPRVMEPEEGYAAVGAGEGSDKREGRTAA